MIDFFYKLYINIVDKNAFLKEIRFYSLLRWIVRNVANIVLPLYFNLTKSNIQYRLFSHNREEQRLIVSLTSFPARIERLWLVIETLLRQSKKPDMIILWLSKEQFEDIGALPSKLIKQQNRGLTIRLMDGDIRSHKKYFYTLNEYPNDILVTADDDIFYQTNWLQSMFENHQLYPNSVICLYGFHMKYNENYVLAKYNEWKSARKYEENVFFGSGGGVLFPSGCFYNDVTNIDLALQLCPLADDVWLNTMVRLNGCKIIKISSTNIYLPVLNKSKITLCSVNLLDGHNDIQLENITSYYKVKLNIDPYKFVN